MTLRFSNYFCYNVYKRYKQKWVDKSLTSWKFDFHNIQCYQFYKKKNNSGTLPTNDEGEVNRTACIVGLYGNCSKTLNIRVKNCGEYNVYHLVPVPQTSTGYCIGVIESFFILYCICILQCKIYKTEFCLQNKCM